MTGIGILEQNNQINELCHEKTFRICKNKGADQRHSNCEADQHHCFRYTASIILLLSKSNLQPLAIFCACTARFVVTVRKPHCWFSHAVAKIENFSPVMRDPVFKVSNQVIYK